jgi:hypothetical protein
MRTIRAEVQIYILEKGDAAELAILGLRFSGGNI